jgi:hypothetical protein
LASSEHESAVRTANIEAFVAKRSAYVVLLRIAQDDELSVEKACAVCECELVCLNQTLRLVLGQRAEVSSEAGKR